MALLLNYEIKIPFFSFETKSESEFRIKYLNKPFFVVVVFCKCVEIFTSALYWMDQNFVQVIP